MANFLTEVVDGLEWLGKEAEKAVDFVPKVIKITTDVEADAATLLPEAVQVFTGVQTLGLAAIKDGGQVVSSAQTLGLAIEQAAAADGINVAEDVAVIAAFQGFVKQVLASGTWLDVLTALTALTADWDKFGASAQNALKQLEADV